MLVPLPHIPWGPHEFLIPVVWGGATTGLKPFWRPRPGLEPWGPGPPAGPAGNSTRPLGDLGAEGPQAGKQPMETESRRNVPFPTATDSPLHTYTRTHSHTPCKCSHVSPSFAFPPWPLWSPPRLRRKRTWLQGQWQPGLVASGADPDPTHSPGQVPAQGSRPPSWGEGLAGLEKGRDCGLGCRRTQRPCCPGFLPGCTRKGMEGTGPVSSPRAMVLLAGGRVHRGEQV